MAFTKMKKGQRFMLHTFNGTENPDKECDESENYWKLIEEQGVIVNNADELGFPNKNRVLFQFDYDFRCA